MNSRRIDALLAEADVLAEQVRSARAEAIRVGGDPYATDAAVQRAEGRLAYATGRLNGFSAVVGAALAKRPKRSLMAGAYLPPVVASLTADAADCVAKIAEVKAALEDLQKTPTDIPITADISAAVAQIAALRDDARAIGGVAIPVTLADENILGYLLTIRTVLQGMANTMAVDIPVRISGIGAALAEFTAAALAMRAVATAAGGGPGKGGLLAILGWGGGMFGAAAFGSVLSLAGFGFEHLATTVLGLAGSLAGALAGAAVLAGGALARMAVGAGADTLVMLEANQAIKALVVGIEAAANATPTEKALAALASGTLTLAQATLLYGKAAATAMQQTAKLQIATDLYWLHSIAPALVQLAALKDSLLGLAQTYIPLIAWAAQKNFALIRAGLQPLLSWLEGPTGLGIFKNLEEMFATSLPSALMAFDNGVELVLKILNYAAGFTGKFIANLALWLQTVNTGPSSVWQGWVNTVIGLWNTWWGLIKQVGITLFDIFIKSAGLGTTLVTIVTQLLVQVDKYLGSTATSNGMVHSVFQVHLQEVEALISALVPLAAAFAQAYMVIAIGLTKLVTWLADALGWVSRLTVVGPWLVMGAAVSILVAKMKLLAVGSAVIAGMRSMMLAAQGISAAFSAGGMMAGLNALKSFFAGGNWSKLFGGASPNIVALDANTAALNRLTGMIGGELVTGGGGGGGGLPPIAAGGGAGMATLLGTLSAYLGPLAYLINQVKNDWTVIQYSSAQAKTAMSGEVAAIVHYLSGTALGASMSQAEMQALAVAVANGQVQTKAQLTAWIAHWVATNGSANLTSAESNTMAAIVKNGSANVGVNLILWEDALMKTGVSAGVANAAVNALTAFIAKNGPITANEMGLFQSMATNTAMSAKTMAADVAVISAFVAAHGPLTTNEMLAIQNDLANGVTSAFDINLTLKTINMNLQPAVRSAAGMSAAIAALRAAIPGSVKLPGLGWFAAGGIANYPASGGLAMLHGTEMVVPKSKADPLLWSLMSNAVAGKPLAFTPAPMPSGGIPRPTPPALIGNAGATGRGGSPSVTVQMGDINVVVPNGTPASVGHQIGGHAREAVNKALHEAVRHLSAGSKQYGFLPG